jgi:hypothetical protein
VIGTLALDPVVGDPVVDDPVVDDRSPAGDTLCRKSMTSRRDSPFRGSTAARRFKEEDGYSCY